MTQPGSSSTDHDGIGTLRAAITLLVIAHHAVLAYHPFAPPPFASLHAAPFWQAFPVVDPDRWNGALWFAGVNDTFFMSLMFLISGLFVWRSLTAKGPARYLRDRARRLGLPFLVAAAVLAPLAYLPSHLQTGAAASWSGFWRDWLALESWPAGPAWFLWVLLAFNLVAVALSMVTRRWGERLGTLFGAAARRPLVAFAIVVVASAAAYVPLALAVSPLRWSALGPFVVQTSRALHYLVYFLAGVGIGAAGLERGLVSRGAKLAARWPLWLVGAAAAFALAAYIASRDIASGGAPAWQLADAFGFVIACAALSFAFLAGFVRLAPLRSRILASLRASAYAMYIVHYAIVSWLQYALLGAALPGLAKACLAFGGAAALSWVTALGLRRLAGAARAPSAAAPIEPRSHPADRTAA
jgi:peptidoglycan/LPS O-acetylase OafA/YrhL